MKVKTEDIDKIMFKKFRRQKYFDLVDAMIAGKTEKALKYTERYRFRTESPHMVLSLIPQFRIILKCKSLSESGSSGSDMAKNRSCAICGKRSCQDKQEFQLRNAFKASLNKCLETDYLIKTGANRTCFRS